MTLDWLQAFPDKDWCWGTIGDHLNMSSDWVDAFPDKPWDSFVREHGTNYPYRSCECECDCPCGHLEDYCSCKCYDYQPRCKWGSWTNTPIPTTYKDLEIANNRGELEMFSSDPIVTIDIILQYGIDKWHWGNHGISGNINITPEWIDIFSNQPWHWGLNRECGFDVGGISRNKAFSPKWIQTFPHKPWNWIEIQENPVPIWKSQFISNKTQELQKQKSAVQVIENWYLQCRYNPKYAYCRRKNKEKMDELMDEK